LRPRETAELTPCDRLKLAQAQLDRLLTGGAVRVVETPQLGRVEYGQVSALDLGRLIDALKRECAEYLGVTPTNARRRISVEVDP
jgi:hypothetical protein